MPSEYKVENDEYYKNFEAQPSRNEKTTDNYRKTLIKFCRATNKTLDKIITTCIDEQNIVTTIKLDPDENGNERRKEIKFNINSKDAAINKFLNQFEDYCFEKNNKEITIQNQTDMVRSFLHENGVELPKRKSYKDDSRDWYLPSKIDFNYFLQDVSLVHASLVNILTSSGMRVSDALSLTIGDFMSATADYHDFVDVEDFIDNAPEDMIAQWIFEPQKTRKHHVKCITFNSAHTSNMILQNLRHIKNQYIPYKNRMEGLNLSISKKDPLFGSRKSKYKKPINGKSVSAYWIEKNKKFHVWKINQIKQQIENGEISEEDYNEAVSKIPKLHPHICRKFFSTIVSNNCGDIRVCALLEGHSDGLPNDKSYIKKNVEDIKEIYINDIHDALSLDNVETKIISDKETERLNAEIESLKAENAKIREEKDQEISNMKQKHHEEIDALKNDLARTKDDIKDLDKKINQSNLIPFNKVQEIISKYLHNIGEFNNMERASLLELMIYDYARKNPNEFKDTNEYLSELIRKLDIKIEMSNKDISEQRLDIFNDIDFEKIDSNFFILVDELLNLVKNNEGVMKRVGKINVDKFDQVAEEYLINNGIIENISNIDLSKISEDDKIEIAGEVLIKYIEYG